MLELDHREHHLLSGIGAQILIVALMVFAYTQAIRQLRHRADLRDRQKEQLTVCRDELARHTRRPDVAALQQQVAELKSVLLSRRALEELARQLKDLARERYGVEKLEVMAGDRPTQILAVPLDGRLDFEAHLYALELSGVTTTRSAAALVAAMGESSPKLLAALVGMEMRRSGPGDDQPVHLSLRWRLAISPASEEAALSAPLQAPARPEWGWRDEIFSSPFESPNALRIPPQELSRFRLSGIVWDERAPSCVINGEVLRPGDAVSGHRVVLITPQAVLLEGPEGELLLRP